MLICIECNAKIDDMKENFGELIIRTPKNGQIRRLRFFLCKNCKSRYLNNYPLLDHESPISPMVDFKKKDLLEILNCVQRYMFIIGRELDSVKNLVVNN